MWLTQFKSGSSGPFPGGDRLWDCLPVILGSWADLPQVLEQREDCGSAEEVWYLFWLFHCVKSTLRSMRAFPHPHFDKQIPDQQVVMLERLHCTKEKKWWKNQHLHTSLSRSHSPGEAKTTVVATISILGKKTYSMWHSELFNWILDSKWKYHSRIKIERRKKEQERKRRERNN